MAKRKEKRMEPTVTEQKGLSNPADLEAWGTQEVSREDIVIPRILIMQGMSDFVSDGKAKLGDIVENLQEKVLGGIDGGIEILPFKCDRVWKVISSNGKVLSTEPITSENSSLPFECEVDGEPAKRFRALQYYVLLPSEIEGGGALPYMVEFKSTALSAGKKMYTQMYTVNRSMNLNPAAKTFMLSTDKVSNTKGTFAVPDVSVLRDTSEGEQAEALNWFKALKQGGARVHDEEI